LLDTGAQANAGRWPFTAEETEADCVDALVAVEVLLAEDVFLAEAHLLVHIHS